MGAWQTRWVRRFRAPVLPRLFSGGDGFPVWRAAFRRRETWRGPMVLLWAGLACGPGADAPAVARGFPERGRAWASGADAWAAPRGFPERGRARVSGTDAPARGFPARGRGRGGDACAGVFPARARDRWRMAAARGRAPHDGGQG